MYVHCARSQLGFSKAVHDCLTVLGSAFMSDLQEEVQGVFPWLLPEYQREVQEIHLLAQTVEACRRHSTSPAWAHSAGKQHNPHRNSGECGGPRKNSGECHRGSREYGAAKFAKLRQSSPGTCRTCTIACVCVSSVACGAYQSKPAGRTSRFVQQHSRAARSWSLTAQACNLTLSECTTASQLQSLVTF